MSKRKHHTLVSKPLAARTFDKAAALIKELDSNPTPEARSALKNIKASHHKKYEKRYTKAKMGDFWNPNGKPIVKGTGVKATKISRSLAAQQRVPM